MIEHFFLSLEPAKALIHNPPIPYAYPHPRYCFIHWLPSSKPDCRDACCAGKNSTNSKLCTLPQQSTKLATTQQQLNADPNNLQYQAQLQKALATLRDHPLAQEGHQLGYNGQVLRIEAQKQKDHLYITHGDPHHGPGFSLKDYNAVKQCEAEAKQIKQEVGSAYSRPVMLSP